MYDSEQNVLTEEDIKVPAPLVTLPPPPDEWRIEERDHSETRALGHGCFGAFFLV